MSRKIHLLSAVLTLVFASLACNIGQTTTDPLAAQQALLAKIPQHYSNTPQVDKTYVGALDGSTAFIAVVVQNSVAVVYICDGDQISEWFGGSVSKDQLDFTSAKGTHLTASAAADSVSGTLALAGGQPLAFVAQPAVEGQTGLFRFKGDQDKVTYTTGWIVTQTGARGETNSANGVQNGLVINIDPAATAQTALRLRSDDHEYTIAFQGVGYNLHTSSVLQLPVNPGQNDFDYFCNDTKYFAGGIQVPEGQVLTVDLVADGCQVVTAQAAPPPVSDTQGQSSSSSGGAANQPVSSGAGQFGCQAGLGGFGTDFNNGFHAGFGSSGFNAGFQGGVGFTSGFGALC
jgi:hypothetical protein